MPLLGEQKDVPQPLQQPGCAQVEARDDRSEPVLFGPGPARSPDGAAETLLQTSARTIETRAAMLPLHKMLRINEPCEPKRFDALKQIDGLMTALCKQMLNFRNRL